MPAGIHRVDSPPDFPEFQSAVAGFGGNHWRHKQPGEIKDGKIYKDTLNVTQLPGGAPFDRGAPDAQ